MSDTANFERDVPGATDQALLDHNYRCLKIDRFCDVAGQVGPSFCWMIAVLGCLLIASSQAVGCDGQTLARWVERVILAGSSLAGIGYGVKQRRIKENTIQEMGSFRQKYEALLDPDRTSSRLTERGRTPKKKKGHDDNS